MKIEIEEVKYILFWLTERQGGFFFHQDRNTVLARKDQLVDTKGIEPLIYEFIEPELPIKNSQIPCMFMIWAEKYYKVDLENALD